MAAEVKSSSWAVWHRMKFFLTFWLVFCPIQNFQYFWVEGQVALLAPDEVEVVHVGPVGFYFRHRAIFNL